MKPEKVYACFNKDKDVRLSSSSGAVFSSLAEYVLNKNGIIYAPEIRNSQIRHFHFLCCTLITGWT